MNDESSIIIDSDFSFSDAIVGANTPLEIIDCLPMVDVYEKGVEEERGISRVRS